MLTVDIRTLRGLPVTAKVTVCPAEPEVGIMGPYFDEVILCHHVTGKPLGEWVWKRIWSIPGEEDRLYDAIWCALRALDDGRY